VATVATISGHLPRYAHNIDANVPLARRREPNASETGGKRPCLMPNAAHIRAMINREQLRAFIDHPVVEWSIFVLGVLLMIASIPVGALPGPGGIFVFAAGLALVLKTSMWAKRRYVDFKRKQPKIGRWTDWGLRRQSARRREALRKEQDGTDEASQIADQR